MRAPPQKSAWAASRAFRPPHEGSQRARLRGRRASPKPRTFCFPGQGGRLPPRGSRKGDARTSPARVGIPPHPAKNAERGKGRRRDPPRKEKRAAVSRRVKESGNRRGGRCAERTRRFFLRLLIRAALPWGPGGFPRPGQFPQGSHPRAPRPRPRRSLCPGQPPRGSSPCPKARVRLCAVFPVRDNSPEVLIPAPRAQAPLCAVLPRAICSRAHLLQDFAR